MHTPSLAIPLVQPLLFEALVEEILYFGAEQTGCFLQSLALVEAHVQYPYEGVLHGSNPTALFFVCRLNLQNAV